MGSLLIRNGTIVTATDHYQADVYIEGETVSMIGASLDVPADREIDAQDCYLFPGGIDAHTHMELPFMGTHASDTFESGTLAGLHGVFRLGPRQCQRLLAKDVLASLGRPRDLLGMAVDGRADVDGLDLGVRQQGPLGLVSLGHAELPGDFIGSREVHYRHHLDVGCLEHARDRFALGTPACPNHSDPYTILFHRFRLRG